MLSSPCKLDTVCFSKPVVRAGTMGRATAFSHRTPTQVLQLREQAFALEDELFPFRALAAGKPLQPWPPSAMDPATLHSSLRFATGCEQHVWRPH